MRWQIVISAISLSHIHHFIIHQSQFTTSTIVKFVTFRKKSTNDDKCYSHFIHQSQMLFTLYTSITIYHINNRKICSFWGKIHNHDKCYLHFAKYFQESLINFVISSNFRSNFYILPIIHAWSELLLIMYLVYKFNDQ